MNMPHCRFTNTLEDLKACHDHLFDRLSKREHNARKDIVKLCQKIITDAEGNNVEFIPLDGPED